MKDNNMLKSQKQKLLEMYNITYIFEFFKIFINNKKYINFNRLN